MNQGQHIVVIGAGILGLTLSYDLLKAGYKVTLLEAEAQIGGMSASFDCAGMRLERYYHFFCLPDKPLFQLLRELGLEQKLVWRRTTMGFFYEGKLYDWGTPKALFRFPQLNLFDKLRFGLLVWLSIKHSTWSKLDSITAKKWINSFIGSKAYDVLFESLLHLKFHQFEDVLSAAWIWRRLRRVGRSRDKRMKETLAYLSGGVELLLNALHSQIITLEGTVWLNSPVDKVYLDNGRVSGVRVKGQDYPCDTVISTIPLPYIAELIPDLSSEVKSRFEQIDNIGIVCVVLKLQQKLTDYFWLNISDSRIALPGLIEYSNLNSLSSTTLYFPFYLHRTHPDFGQSDDVFKQKVNSYCRMINADFTPEWIEAAFVHRYEYAQPVCVPHFLEHLPPIRSEIHGLFTVDTSYYYPEDRSMSESIRVARELAQLLQKESKTLSSDSKD
ncbi:NAD(P)/FAD-dependent oxidoreductase [bacterium]|nr:NAD(P)/FAD-dependent oxidoreductase [bacterium]